MYLSEYKNLQSTITQGGSNMTGTNCDFNYLYIQPNALYYLKLKTIYNIYSCNQQKANQASKSGFKDTPEDGARLAPKHVG
jgi:hypothetical protein